MSEVTKADLENWLNALDWRASDLYTTLNAIPSAAGHWKHSLDRHRFNRASDALGDALALIRAETIFAIRRHENGDLS